MHKHFSAVHCEQYKSKYGLVSEVIHPHESLSVVPPQTHTPHFYYFHMPVFCDAITLV